MTFTAEVWHGVIKLPDGLSLPNGTVVQGELTDGGAEARVQETGGSYTTSTARPQEHHGSPEWKPEANLRSLADDLAEFVGIIDDAPADGAEQLDHYLYGTAKH